MTDQELLSQIQRLLIEVPNGGASWSELWSHAEVIDLLNQRMQRMLRETHLTAGIAEVAETMDQEEVTLPDDWVATLLVLRRVAGVFSEIPIGDTWQLDHGYGIATTPGTPQLFVDREGETLEARLFPPPAVAATLEVYYVPFADRATGDNDTLVIPNDFCLAGLKWGILADMLAKTARAQDTARAQYAAQRYQLSIEIAKLILSGGA